MDSILAQGTLGFVSLLVVLGLVVVIHELGHYLAGRAFGAAAESFSFGFGKPIYERSDKRNTRWRINWIPFGGFVKFVGESQTAGDVGKIEDGPIGKKFMDLTVGQRSIIAAAGPLANIVLAVILYAIVALNLGKGVYKVSMVSFVDGPAKEAGFEPNDLILALNGKPVDAAQDVQLEVSLSTGDTLTFLIERDGQPIEIDVVPVRMNIESNIGQKVSEGRIGVYMEAVEVDRVRFSPWGAVGEGANRTAETVVITGRMLKRLISGREPITQLNGPVGIGDVSRRLVGSVLEQEAIPLATRMRALGWTLMQLIAAISIGVGLANLLPLPVLDGGHLVFNAYEAVTGSVLPQRVQEITLTFGAIFLLGIGIIVTAGDIVKTGILQSFGG